MSLNQAAPVGTAGYGGVFAGQYEPIGEVRSRSSGNAGTAAIARGELITIVKTGGTKGKFRTAVAGDTTPFAMAIEDKALNGTRVVYVSQPGIKVYLIADGAITPGMPVVATAAGKVVEAVPSDVSTAPDSAEEYVGVYLKKAVDVTGLDGVSIPADAAQNDIVVIETNGNWNLGG
jgi:hypothetical protein